MSNNLRWTFQELEPYILALLTAKETKNGYAFLLKVMGHLEPDMFDGTDTGVVFKVFDGFYREYKTIPDEEVLLSILTKINYKIKDTFLLEQIYEKTDLTESKIAFIMKEIPNFVRKRKLYTAILDSSEIIDKEQFEDFDKIEKFVRDALSYQLDTDVGLHYIDDAQFVVDELSSTKHIIKSFSKSINMFLQYGGYTKEEIYCYLGASGRGKSIFLVNEGIAACKQGKNVLHISFELDEIKTLQRYYKSFLQLDQKDIVLRGGEAIQKSLRGKKLTGWGHLRVKRWPAYSANALSVSRFIEQLSYIHNFRVDMLIIDYVDLMNPISKTGRRYDDQGRAMVEARAIGQDFKIPVITATQATRSAIDAGDIGQEHTADSIDKVRPLDWLAGIINTLKMRQDGYIDIRLLKNRNGEEGVVLRFMIDYMKMTITDRPEFLDFIEKGGRPEDFNVEGVPDEDQMAELVKEKPQTSKQELQEEQSDYIQARNKEKAERVASGLKKEGSMTEIIGDPILGDVFNDD